MDEQTKQEIQAEYFRMGYSLTQVQPFTNGKKFMALSQYGYVFETDFDSIDLAEEYVFNYYSDKMNLIRQ